MEGVTAQQALEARLQSQRDPLWWLQNILGVEPWGLQRQIVESIRDNPRTAVRACHGAGKSWLAACSVLWFLYSHPRAVVVTTAPTFRQVEKIIWQEIGRLHGEARYQLGGTLLQTEIKISPGWFAFGFAADKARPDSAQGVHSPHVLVIIDEAAGVEETIWIAIDGYLSGTHARLLSIGNPTDGQSVFAKEFSTPGTVRFSISAFDTPNFSVTEISIKDIREGNWKAKQDAYIAKHGSLPAPYLTTPAWVADKYRRWGESSPLWLARVLGQFPEISKDTLIPLSWIEKAHEKYRQEHPNRDLPLILGVDVARYGDDETCIYGRRGEFFQPVEAFGQADTMETAGKIRQLIREFKPAAVNIDAIGVGGGVYDRLKELGQTVFEYIASRKARDSEKFANLRAESFWGLRERAEEGRFALDPDDEEATGQLAALKYKIKSSGQIILEPKEDTKKRLGRSPDRADAIAIASVDLETDEIVIY